MSDLLLGQRDRFVARNSFLYAVLGLRSLSLRTEGLAASAAKLPTETVPGDDELRLAILGALSLARRLQGHLTIGAEGAVPSVQADRRTTTQSPRDLAR